MCKAMKKARFGQIDLKKGAKFLKKLLKNPLIF